MPTNLNAKSLKAHLLAQGADGYQINRLGDDEFCLIQEGGVWKVVYAERGFVQEVLFESGLEAEACAFLFDYVTRFRHSHSVGKFIDQAEAQTFGAQLTQLGIKHEMGRIRWSGDDWRYRVAVYGPDVFKVRRQYGKLPLERVPTLPERIHDAIRRLSQFEPNHEYQLNPPVDAIEQQVWSVLEFSRGFRIPELYSRFLLEVDDGGQFSSALRYLSMREVFELNDPNLYKQPVPRFVRAALDSQQEEIEIPSCDITAGFPGLLRISHFSYNQMAHYLTQSGEYVFIEHLSQGVRVSVERLSLEQFYQRSLEIILGGAFGKLQTYERTQELMQFGFSLEDLEKSLGATASLEWKHGIIATILKTTPDNLEQKLLAWQEQHGV
ncbi:MAG: hypothetical protein SFU83_22165 [Meiothermus sp.]|nr:hypothetical protein [Meiothermus sp.]